MNKARDNYGKALAFIETALTQETDECIIWPFTNHTNGYPSIGHGRHVNRVVCERAYGKPPSLKHQAAHSCGVKLCINKRHVRWATRAENEADKLKHGTSLLGRTPGNRKGKKKGWRDA